METKEALRSRRSVKVYDPTREVTDKQLAELFELTTLAPSAWNFQHYQFIAVRSPEQKKKLREAALNQEKVEQASVTLVVCGDLHAYKRADRVAQDFADKGFYGPNGQEKVEKQAKMMAETYQNNPQLARDEAIRSASLAAMSLMIAARDMGLATCPMIGFDADTVRKVVQLPEHLFPVMLVSLGYQGAEPLPRNDRLPLSEVVHIDSFGQPFQSNP
ncbi:nitroreductase family protein [Paenactinomyces guangxiensis]|uniref:Nitroreductase family protein n=1 Tax=Paenactinomyces guangxiensis TaxID=1490290 RepID=A0A7W2A6N7_9BACL|nr:nitroreductase family protein [Paenactinomyces guangxiensis]MBA4493591.1 nitroreductase family protein [Paenactinomyces guangxiensis]MBH8590878.1 nitroreductase family protein [Paenactinomyces guangxiensis]